MPDRHYRVSGLCDDPACDCRRVFGIPADEPHTVLIECMHCPAMIETRTGEQGVQDAIAAGWEIDGAGDLVCAKCTEARAEMIGDETC